MADGKRYSQMTDDEKKAWREQRRAASAAWHTEDTSRMAALEAEVAELSAGDLDVEVRKALVRLTEGESWWDLQSQTGLPEDECRRIVALAAVLRKEGR